MKFLPALFATLCLLALCSAATSANDLPGRLEVARRQAAAALETIAGVAAPSAAADVERSSLGSNLAHYANNPGADPARYENLVDAARRILAGGTPEKRTPDATSEWLDDTATVILAVVREAETSRDAARDPQLKAKLAELRARALLARFHARRMFAAVHYNLFKRGLRLAELVAATYAEKDAVIVWRELVAQVGNHPFAADWRAELKRLEASLKDLEEQCCPPDEAILREKVWQPARRQAAGAK